MSEAPPENVMEQIVSLCKRRGFIYPASEIYGGIKGFWDYGPLGVLLKNNIRDWWWRQMVLCPPLGPDGHPVDMVGLDSAIIQHPKTWEASGHVAGFNDPMVDDRVTKQRFRADQFYGVFFVETPGPKSGAELAGRILTIDRRAAELVEAGMVPAVTLVASSRGEAFTEFLAGMKKLSRDLRLPSVDASGGMEMTNAHDREGRNFEVLFAPISLESMERYHEAIPSPFGERKPGTLTAPRPFNLMLFTYPGPIQDEANKAYLRPETAQGIFLNFKNIVDTTRVKVPFGVAQVGKSFRNEVTPRNYIFRSREFEQMEMEWFCAPDDALAWYDFWKHERMRWWESLGVSKEKLRFRDHASDELAHYSKACVDIEYRYPFTAPDFGELEGIAHRGDYDLTQHQTHSGQKLDYFDQDLQLTLKEQGVGAEEVKARSRYLPNVIEPASGLTRAALVLLCEAFTIDETRPSKYVLKFLPKFAPIKAGIFPLVNKDGMPEVAERLYLQLRQKFTCEYDPKQAIGKRYARNDEIGTPFCFTVDGDTLKDQTVTVRNRDDALQQRIAIDKVESFLRERIGDQ